MNKKNLIFLDIDGVLATEEDSWIPPHELYAYPFNPNCVRIFNAILKETNVKIVLSSDWRLIYQNDLVVLDEIFKYNSVVQSPIDVTPNFIREASNEVGGYIRMFNKNREKEITAYIERNYNEIDKFVILDDADLKIHPNNFVKCNITEGLKEEGIKEKIIAILRG
jgi:hypothetical protein